MYRGRAVALSSISSILRSKQTLTSLQKHQPYVLSSLSSHGMRSALFEFPRMEEETRLYLVSHGQMFGIKISELMRLGKEEKKKEAKDWETIPPVPFDFSAEVPDRDCFLKHRFVLDSKLYLAGGGSVCCPDHLTEFNDELSWSPLKRRKISVMCDTGIEEYEVLDNTPWCKIYQFDVNNYKFVPADPNSIPPPPTPFVPRFLGNISGHHDVYCLALYGSLRPDLQGFWVLSSSSRQRIWKRLPNPPFLESNDLISGQYNSCFVFQDKFFLLAVVDYAFYIRRNILFSFDPTTAKWTLEDLDVLKNPFLSEKQWFDHLIPSVSVSLNNCPVALSYMTKDDETDTSQPPDGYYSDEPVLDLLTCVTAITANENGAGFCYQLLPECLHGIQPSYTQSYFMLIDLGNNMVCALLYVYTPYHDDGRTPVLCISVFTVKMVEPTIGIVNEAPQERREDLYVEIHAKCSFSLKGYMKNNIWSMHSFVYAPQKLSPHYNNDIALV